MGSVKSRLSFCFAAALALSGTVATAQTAEDTSAFAIELNSAAETDAGGCRLTFVAANQSDLAFDRTAFQVGFFDADGVVTRLLLLEFGALTEGRTKILQFDLGVTPCADISRITLNDVAACTLAGTEDESTFCDTRIAASSRTAIQFGL